MLVWWRGENRSTRRKTSRSKGARQKQTQPTYGVDTRFETRATLEGGEGSHHCATLSKKTTTTTKKQYSFYVDRMA